MEATKLFNYARNYADKAERTGRGTQFPTVRQAAKRFKVPQDDILDVVECAEVSLIPGADYFALAVAVGISGVGHRGYDSPADYQLEAYRSPTPEAAQK